MNIKNEFKENKCPSDVQENTNTWLGVITKIIQDLRTKLNKEIETGKRT